jgi:hypothetical protein
MPRNAEYSLRVGATPGARDRWFDPVWKRMALWRRPLGIWILCVWCLLQGGPAFLASFGSSGVLRFAVWVFFLLQAALVAGLLVPLKSGRYALIAYLAGNILAFAFAGWFFVFVGVAWGLRPAATLTATCIALYLLFLTWAFLYRFNPDVAAYFDNQRTFGDFESI